ncbi:hypothetical protein YC2023_005011 [Brassica napus]
MCSLSPSSLLPIKLKPGYSEKRSNSSNSLFVSKRRSKRKNILIVPLWIPYRESLKILALFGAEGKIVWTGDLSIIQELTPSLTAEEVYGCSIQLQGWANKIYRDEVVAEWKKVKGKKSLHVHCRISGGHFLLDMLAKFGYYIFCKELPVGTTEGGADYWIIISNSWGSYCCFMSEPELKMVYIGEKIPHRIYERDLSNI